MKKYLKSIALMLVLIMTLSACVSPYGDGTVTERKTSNKETSVTEQPAKEQETSDETTAEETTKKNMDGIDLHIIFEEELEKPVEQYTVEDFPEIEEIVYLDFAKTLRGTSIIITIPKDAPKEQIQKILELLNAREDVYSANEISYGLCMIIDPSTTDIHYLNEDQWGLSAINIESAWDITTGSSSIKVGIVDSGIDYTHADLQGKVNIGLSRSFITTGTDEEKSPLCDLDGHGTHVAGIIGANAAGAEGDIEGIAGICWDVTLISLKICNEEDNISLDNVISAIEYADEIGIDILNMSFQLKLNDNDDIERLNEAVENYDGLIVCAAGNMPDMGLDIETRPIYLAVSDAPNVITVGAMGEDFNKIDVSNYGATKVDLFAPGDNIISCQAGVTNGYVYKSGTSMATPHVAGVAALLLSAYPDMDAIDVKETIMKRVNKVMDEYDQYLFEGLCVSKGILDAEEALERPVYHTHQYSSTAVIHRMECYCGDYYMQPHSYTVPTDYGNLTYHKLLCICGHEGGLEAHVWELNYSGNSASDVSVNYVPEYKCRKCNARTLTPGVIS